MELSLASLAERAAVLAAQTPAEWFSRFLNGAENAAGNEWDDSALDYLALLHLLPEEMFQEFWEELPADLRHALTHPDRQLDRMLKNAERDMGLIFTRMTQEDRRQCQASMGAITSMLEAHADAALIMAACRDLLLRDMDREEDEPFDPGSTDEDRPETYPDDPEDYHWGESESLSSFWVVLDNEVIDYLPTRALMRDWLHNRPVPADLAEAIVGTLDLEEATPPAGTVEAALVASSLKQLEEICEYYTKA